MSDCYSFGGIRCGHWNGQCNQANDVVHPVMNPDPPELVADLNWIPTCQSIYCELCVEIKNKKR
jgi:hypothetical protein